MSKELQTLLAKNSALHLIVENEVRQTPFGQITVVVEVADGVAKIDTLNITKWRRRKYEGAKPTLDETG